MLKYDDHIETLIDLALLDAVITEKEREVLIKKANERNIDIDEFNLVLDAKLLKRKEEIASKIKQEKTLKIIKPLFILVATFILISMIYYGYYFSLLLGIIFILMLLPSKNKPNGFDTTEKNYSGKTPKSPDTSEISEKNEQNKSITGSVIDLIADGARWFVKTKHKAKYQAMVNSDEFQSLHSRYGMTKDEWTKCSQRWLNKDPKKFARILKGRTRGPVSKHMRNI